MIRRNFPVLWPFGIKPKRLMCSKGFHEGGRGPIILPLPFAQLLGNVFGYNTRPKPSRGHISPGGPQPLEANPKNSMETSNYVVSVRPVGMGHQRDVCIKGRGHLHHAMEVTRLAKVHGQDLPCTGKDRPSQYVGIDSDMA